MSANYTDITPDLLRRVSDFMLAKHGARSNAAATLSAVAADMDADGQRKAEAAELEALGGTEDAERGWLALRKHNPRVDRTTGVDTQEIHTFADLPHRQKVNYAVFAAGVQLGVKREPRVFYSIDDVPGDVTLLTANDGDLVKRAEGTGWWWVGDADEELPDDGWEWTSNDNRYLPLTEVVS